MKYNLGFTAGALLVKEADIYINSIDSAQNFYAKEEEISYLIIPTNSESGKKRIKAELDKRLFHLDPEYLEFYKSASETDKKIILFLSICKSYTIIAEFALEVVYSKWKQFDYDISPYDFDYFLSKKLTNVEVDRISEKTKYKLSQVAIKIFKDLGILQKEKIAQIFPSEKLKQLLLSKEDGWLLNCLMIPNIDF